MQQEVLFDVSRRVARRVHPQSPTEMDVLANTREDYEVMARSRAADLIKDCQDKGWPELRVENYVSKSLWRQGSRSCRDRNRREKYSRLFTHEDDVGQGDVDAHEQKASVESALEARNVVRHLIPKLNQDDLGLLRELSEVRTLAKMFDPERHTSYGALRRRVSRVRAKAREVLADLGYSQ